MVKRSFDHLEKNAPRRGRRRLKAPRRGIAPRRGPRRAAGGSTAPRRAPRRAPDQLPPPPKGRPPRKNFHGVVRGRADPPGVSHPASAPRRARENPKRPQSHGPEVIRPPTELVVRRQSHPGWSRAGATRRMFCRRESPREACARTSQDPQSDLPGVVVPQTALRALHKTDTRWSDARNKREEFHTRHRPLRACGKTPNVPCETFQRLSCNHPSLSGCMNLTHGQTMSDVHLRCFESGNGRARRARTPQTSIVRPSGNFSATTRAPPAV